MDYGRVARTWTSLAFGLGQDWRQLSRLDALYCPDPNFVDSFEPDGDLVPTNNTGVHHLQVVDSKRLTIASHMVDRTGDLCAEQLFGPTQFRGSVETFSRNSCLQR